MTSLWTLWHPLNYNIHQRSRKYFIGEDVFHIQFIYTLCIQEAYNIIVCTISSCKWRAIKMEKKEVANDVNAISQLLCVPVHLFFFLLTYEYIHSAVLDLRVNFWESAQLTLQFETLQTLSRNDVDKLRDCSALDVQVIQFAPRNLQSICERVNVV